MKNCSCSFIFLLLLFELACTQGTRNSAESLRVNTPPITLKLLQNRSELLLKDRELEEYIQISEQGIRLYASPEDRRKGIVECYIYPEEYPRFVKLLKHYSLEQIKEIYLRKGTTRWSDAVSVSVPVPELPFRFGQNPRAPLRGLRVAVDPGHMAETFSEAELEGKYVKLRMDEDPESELLILQEANLTLVTAMLIREQLEELGATVLLTRERAGLNVEGISYNDWRTHDFEEYLAEELELGNFTKEEADYYQSEAEEKEIYSLFNQLDLKKRAEIINHFSPHASLIIHYNVHSPNWELRDEENVLTPTDVNYCMAFVPGAFMAGELPSIEERIHLLRLLLTDQLEQSLLLSNAFIESSKDYTEVPIVTAKHGLSYLQNACVETYHAGVYARNLSLTRLVKSPICYGESLCQDNRKEALALAQKNLRIGDLYSSKRLQDVANAYVEAVLEYAGKL